MHRRRASVPRRNGEREHLPHALARDPEIARRRALAHPVPARQTDLAIQLHGVNPPALPATGKGRHTGRALLRRSGTVPPLPWSTFAPPFAPGEENRAQDRTSAAATRERHHRPEWRTLLRQGGLRRFARELAILVDDVAVAFLGIHLRNGCATHHARAENPGNSGSSPLAAGP